MNALIEAAFSRARVVVIAFLMLLVVGALAYVSIPKESNPEVSIPTLYVSVSLDGISPEDAANSLAKPLEAELSAIEGLDTYTSTGQEGGATIQLEFDPGFDAEKALDDVRQAVDRAKPNLPQDANDPVVREINTSLFPIMTVALAGPVPERTLNAIADELADRIEALPGVLEVDVGGKREQQVEIIVDPLAFATYDLSLADVMSRVSANNKLIAAGALTTGEGRMVLKLPGLISSAEEVLDLPIKVVGSTVVSFRDVATIRSTFVDPDSYARIDGEPAVSLEIKKKTGANIIETVEGVKAILAGAADVMPEGVKAVVQSDQSEQVTDLLGDLQNNVMASILLVVVVILFFLGPRSAFLVGLSIPGAFLTGVAALWFSGFTMNLIVLFGLILVVGMLVDGAIVVIEYADRRMNEGCDPRKAFSEAAKRMAWPIIASTATTLSVFLPLLFWEGMVGQFMKYLPITVLMTLTASLVMALVFIPVLGAATSPRRARTRNVDPAPVDPRDAKGPMRIYVRILEATITRPKTTLAVLLIGLFAIVSGYMSHGNGIEFFPGDEPDFAQVQLLARDNLSIDGRDKLLREVEARLAGRPHIESLYARSSASGGRGSSDQIGTVQVKFTDWQTRPAAAQIIADLRKELADIAGVDIQIQAQSHGPSGGKPISLEVTGPAADRNAAIDRLIAKMEELGGITDISDTRTLPGLDYEIRVDRNEAARFGASPDLIGQVIRLMTSGVKITDFRPGDSADTIDIQLRFPETHRSLDQVQAIRIPTTQGMVPIGNFVEMAPVARSGKVLRIDGQTVDQISAGVGPGVLPSEKTRAIEEFIAEADFGEAKVQIKGEAKDQKDAMQFLLAAFVAAIVLMLMILITQFNSIRQSLVVLSAIVFSIGGVLLGLMITGRPFGVVMGGIGIIALAGIVVNNNIVLIDAYNERRREGWLPLSAALMTGVERLRPVLLTSVTTVLGLLPMTMAMSVDIPGREITFGAPSTLWWVDLSMSIAGGLTFATALTLLVTPAALVLLDRKDRKRELAMGEPTPV